MYQFNLGEKEDLKGKMCSAIIHACDLYTPTFNFELSEEWAKKINYEFSKQAREEEIMGLEVTPFMQGLENPKIMANSEIQFINVIVKPLWELMNKFSKGYFSTPLTNCENNKKKWEEKLEQMD